MNKKDCMHKLSLRLKYSGESNFSVLFAKLDFTDIKNIPYPVFLVQNTVDRQSILK